MMIHILGFVFGVVSAVLGSQRNAGTPPPVVYVFYSSRDDRQPTELVRFVNGQLAERITIGTDVVYGVEGSRLVVLCSSASGGSSLSIWDLESGSRRSETAVKKPAELLPNSTMIGVTEGLLLEPLGMKALIVSRTEQRALPAGGGKKRKKMETAPPQLVQRYGSMDIKNGTTTLLKPPAKAEDVMGWFPVKDSVGLKLRNGDYVPYSAETDSLGDPLHFEGIAAAWSFYAPGLGLMGIDDDGGKSVLVQLSDDLLRPLEEKRRVDYSAGKQWYGSLPNGHPFVIYYLSESDGHTTVVVRDLTDAADVFRKSFDFEAVSLWNADDGHAFLMIEPTKRALHYERSIDRATWVDYSVLRKPGIESQLVVIPYFRTARRQDRGPD